jgi:hypothetical protein|uniref:hypothetical protein n=1 Tax=Prosthecobacter sp. TaxID=1965333 RepID=UPI003783B459
MTYVIQDQMRRGIRNLLVTPSDNPCGTENTAATPSEIQNDRDIIPKPLLGIRGHEKALRWSLWKSEGPEKPFGSDSGNPNDRENALAWPLKIRSGGEMVRRRVWKSEVAKNNFGGASEKPKGWGKRLRKIYDDCCGHFWHFRKGFRSLSNCGDQERNWRRAYCVAAFA